MITFFGNAQLKHRHQLGCLLWVSVCNPQHSLSQRVCVQSTVHFSWCHNER